MPNSPMHHLVLRKTSSYKLSAVILWMMNGEAERKEGYDGGESF